MALLFKSTPARLPVWQAMFDEAGIPMIPGEDAVAEPADVTAIACWSPPADLTRYPNLRAVLSVGAGVDHFAPLPEGVALVRTLAPGIEEMVRDWTLMATLMLHRDMPTYLHQAREGVWNSRPVRPTSDRRVGIMGMGRIGGLVATGLAALGFDVAGLSRSGREGPVPVFPADRMDGFLARTDLLICLLPLTERTRGILGRETFAALPRGAGLVHAGRGPHLHPDALRDALDAGRVSGAMLDVTDPEPLPREHWMWRDPRILITPHVAAQTDAAEGARHAIAMMRALQDGSPLPGQVDKALGY